VALALRGRRRRRTQDMRKGHIRKLFSEVGAEGHPALIALTGRSRDRLGFIGAKPAKEAGP